MIVCRNQAIHFPDECAARAATVTAQREAQRASVLVHASIAALTEAASQQAATTLTISTRGTGMSEPAHEEELLRQLTQAGVLTAQVARAALGARAGTGASAAEMARLRAAGYSEQTRHDALLRQLLGEERWASYAADPARIVTAAVITDGERAGHDMPALLEGPWPAERDHAAAETGAGEPGPEDAWLRTEVFDQRIEPVGRDGEVLGEAAMAFDHEGPTAGQRPRGQRVREGADAFVLRHDVARPGPQHRIGDGFDLRRRGRPEWSDDRLGPLAFGPPSRVGGRRERPRVP